MDNVGGHRLRALSRWGFRRLIRADECNVLGSRLRPQLPTLDRRAGREGNRSTQAGIAASTSPCPDTQPPSTPSALAQVGATTTSASISWGASSDDVGVAGYGVYLGGVRVGLRDITRVHVHRAACGSTYTVGVDAYDAAGSRSGRPSWSSQPARVRTPRLPRHPRASSRPV